MLHPDHDSVRSVVGRFSRGLRILAALQRSIGVLESCGQRHVQFGRPRVKTVSY